MPILQNSPAFAVMNAQGQIFDATRARSVFEAQLKLAVGLLYPLLENEDGGDLIGADLVAAIWQVAEQRGWKISKSSGEKPDLGERSEGNPTPDSE